MTLQEYLEAVSCKHAGTWNLHLAAAEQTHDKLEFFTMLSSISGIVGTAGQSNYASGGSFQDSFALYRRSLGLAAQSVDLGVVEEVGYLSEHQSVSDRVIRRSGLAGINERQLHEIIKFSILQQRLVLNPESAAQMITGLPFPMPEDSPLLGDLRFRSLTMPHHSKSTDAGVRDPDDEIRAFGAMVKAALPAKRLVPVAVKLLNEQIVRILGLATNVEESKPLSGYGIDSLAAVDLRNWLKTCLGVEISTLDVLNAASLKALCEHIVGRSTAKQ